MHPPSVPFSMPIQIISGTNRPGNISSQVAAHYQKAFLHSGVQTGIVSMEDLPLDLIRGELYAKKPQEFLPFQKLIDETQQFVFIVPEYNGSIPGILKLFIDACEYPGSFARKTAALVGISAGEGGNGKGLNHLRDILEFLGSSVLENQVLIPKIREKFGNDGQTLDTKVQEMIHGHVGVIAEAWSVCS